MGEKSKLAPYWEVFRREVRNPEYAARRRVAWEGLRWVGSELGPRKWELIRWTVGIESYPRKWEELRRTVGSEFPMSNVSTKHSFHTKSS